MEDEVGFARQNGLYADYVPRDFNLGKLQQYTHMGYQALEESGLGKYMWENGIDSAHILGLITLHLGFILSGDPESQKAKDKLYGFAEKVKNIAPRLRELIDVSLASNSR